MQNIRNKMGFFRRQGGYTLIEAVVVIMIIIVLSVVVVDIIYLQAANFTQVFNRSILLGEWRKALFEIRGDVQEIATDNITEMQSNRLTFTNFDGQKIDYQYAPNTLTRNGATVAEWVQADPFQYLDGDQNVTTDSDSLTFIRVSMSLNRSGKAIKLSELLYIRN